jgi:hypothetical protein
MWNFDWNTSKRPQGLDWIGDTIEINVREMGYEGRKYELY